MNSKTFFLIVAGSTIAASILPSLITQLNWLQPSGLGTTGAKLLYKYYKAHGGV